MMKSILLLAFATASLSAQGASASPDTSLTKLVGFYEAAPGRGMAVTLEKDTLYVEPTGGIKTKLVHDSGTTYNATPVAGGTTVGIVFTIGADGKVTELIFRSRNGERAFPKVR